MFRMLADHLAVHLALGWHIDNEVTLDLRLATQPAPFCQGFKFTALAVAGFHVTDRREVIRQRVNCVFTEFAFSTSDLATATEPTTTADRVDINAETACRIEYRSAERKTAPLPRRGKYDPCFFRCHFIRGDGGGDRHGHVFRRQRSARDTSQSTAGNPDRCPS